MSEKNAIFAPRIIWHTPCTERARNKGDIMLRAKVCPRLVNRIDASSENRGGLPALPSCEEENEVNADFQPQAERDISRST